MYRGLLHAGHQRNPVLAAILCRREFHETRRLQLPRQARPRIQSDDVWEGLDGIPVDLQRPQQQLSRPWPEVQQQQELVEVEKQKVENHTNWEQYVVDRRSKTLQEHQMSLERQAFTPFGSIRMDSLNVPKIDGQEDIYLDTLQREMLEEEAAGNEDELQSNESSAVAQLRARYTSTFAEVKSSGTDRNFFFESEDVKVASFSLAKDPHVPSSQKNPAKKMSVAAENFSFRPAVRNVRDRSDVATLQPEFTDKVFAAGPTEVAEVNLFDQQYFANVDKAEVVVQTQTSAQLSEVGSPDNPSPPPPPPPLSDLNVVDEQYFGSARYVDLEVPTDASDTKRMRELVEQSTANLSYIDSQIFIERTPAAGEKSDKLAAAPSRKEHAGKIDGAPVEVSPPPSVIKQKLTSQSNKKDKPKTVNDFQSHASNSAMDYVQKLRRERAGSGVGIAAARNKEQLVDEIGVSLQRKLTLASHQLTVSDVKARAERMEKLERLEESSQQIEMRAANTRLDSKFKPTDLGEMTSLEVISLLQQSIVYNDNDILAINKPYGLPMFGDSSKEPHTVEKYLAKLAAAADASHLYQVHRLDRTTSGVLLLAKSKEMHTTLTDLFRRRLIDKRYWTITRSVPNPSQGIINIPIGEIKIGEKYRMTVQPNYKASSDLITNKRSSNRNRGNREVFPAVTEYRVLSSQSNVSLLEVKPMTGYKHQIRVHLGLGLGCPVVGDHKYTLIDEIGKPQKLPGEVLHRFGIRQSRARDLPLYLHAKHIQIPEVVPGRQVWIDAPIPHFFNRAMKKLKLKPDKLVAI